MSTVQRSWATGFYWIGVAMTLACLVFIAAGNIELLWPFEHVGLPLSWVLAGSAILAFLAFEICDISSAWSSKAEGESSQLSPEWEAVEP